MAMTSHTEDALSPERSEGLNYIEQLTALAVNSCPHPAAPILCAKDSESRTAAFMRAGCGLWSCPVCGARNGRKWLARMLHGTNEIGGTWSFVTLTAHRNWRGASSLANIKKNWHKLRKRAARQKPDGFYYLWVYERHKDKSWHVHMLTNSDAKSKWWKDNAAQCGMGHQCKSVKLDNYRQAAGYIAKYLLKQMFMLDPYPKNMRRITTSRNFPKLPERENDDDALTWMPLFDKASVESYGTHLKVLGWTLKGFRTTIRLIDKYTI